MSLTWQVATQPYNKTSNNYLGIIMSGSLVFTFFLTLAMKTLQELPPPSDPEPDQVGQARPRASHPQTP